ncbi:MAG TPA: hypothetical protein VHQ39_10525, partial [Dongiaceae bacterium]|nr:hypothetical protein [Dongiaceae bacterium]
NVLANALAFLQAQDSVNIDGNIEVSANADYSGSGAHNAWACANLQINATSGSVNVHGNVAVNAVALSNGSESALANAEAEITAAGDVIVVGNISVLANAELDNSSGWGAHSCANLNILAQSGDVSLTGNLRSNAHALGNGDNATESVTANAVMQLETNNGNVSVNGFITVEALASYTGDDHENARACASLDVDASSGDLTINRGVNVVASAVADGTGTASANANAELAAENNSGAAIFGGNVTVIGDINVKGNAQELNSSGGRAQACASLDIDGDSGSIFIDGRIRMIASAHDEGTGNASAIANVDIDAGHNITVTGDIGAFANATHLGSDSGNASAVASVGVNAGNNVSLRGLVAIADADVPDTSASHSANAIATANIGVKAGSNISIGPDGLFADADAFAADGGHADANALIAVDAGQDGIGGVFIRGNAIVIAGAIGGDTGNTALANVHLAGGGATEFGTGASGIFGNVAVIGNIQAFAAADSLHDHANASVEIFAHNNILIIGDDPIASARLGPNGSLVAFRQAHFTTNQSVTGTQGTATADIDIRAGDQVLVFTPSSLERVEKLFAMPTDTPTLNSSGGLSIIPLSIIGDDCGVLGQAGATQAQIDKAKSCHKGPINVSDLTDTLP